MRTVLAITLFISAFCSAWAEPELKGSPKELTSYLEGIPRTVFVSGESEIKVQADQAVISLAVRTESKSLQEALKKNQELRTKILVFLQNHGIDPERAQASKFSSTPKYGFFGDKAKSYEVENTIKVVVRDEKEFQEVASTLDNWPEARYCGIEFESSRKEALKAEALALACAKAVKKKDVFEEKLGIKLVPKSFSDHALQMPREPKLGGTDYMLTAGLRSTEPSYAGTGFRELVSSFGELTYKAEVTIEYSLIK